MSSSSSSKIPAAPPSDCSRSLFQMANEADIKSAYRAYAGTKAK